ncbi:MAG: radical SAM protein [Bacteroidales bacterium]|jgi:wyosine [tRNA(Phe)-imidazoG37] synthetase (radical SAM superfamily)|nr:radical SAM protein [Bacteroidales bacterium]
MYKYLFGPVPSRRLGISLGVDLVPRKVCSLDCVYCEVGKTTKLTTDQKEYIPFEKLKKELTHYFQNNPDPDYITFSGYGEPTLNRRIGDVMQFIKQIKPHIPMAVLTNGTLLNQKEVRDALLKADLILPSLDAATKAGFEKINRPDPLLDIGEIIQGLIDFSAEYTGKIWLEVFILPDYNTNEQELLALKEAILKIKPTTIQLNTLDRPGTLDGLRGATTEELEKVKDFWNLPNVEIVAAVAKRKSNTAYRKDVATAILETIDRRPCTLEDLHTILGMHVNEINKYLGVLEEANKIEIVKRERGSFYKKTE